jgi:hypothetical protein
MSLARVRMRLQMRIVRGGKPLQGTVFGNDSQRAELEENTRAERQRHTIYSNTLSSSFFLAQSAAACTKAKTMGCGFFSVDDNCGWKSVAA